MQRSKTRMMSRFSSAALMLALALSATGADKFPLTMNAVFTKGHTGDASKDATYSSDDYRCTKGDENHAPECQTVTEWAMLDSVAGTPDTVVFTMADGTVVKVQPRTVKKLPGYIVCDPGTVSTSLATRSAPITAMCTSRSWRR
jgi:hypothetical protein